MKGSFFYEPHPFPEASATVSPGLLPGSLVLLGGLVLLGIRARKHSAAQF